VLYYDDIQEVNFRDRTVDFPSVKQRNEKFFVQTTCNKQNVHSSPQSTCQQRKIIRLKSSLPKRSTKCSNEYEKTDTLQKRKERSDMNKGGCLSEPQIYADNSQTSETTSQSLFQHLFISQILQEILTRFFFLF
jgi:hypothetical protein